MTDLEKLEQVLEGFSIESSTFNYIDTKDIFLMSEDGDGIPYDVCIFTFNKEGEFMIFGEVM